MNNIEFNSWLVGFVDGEGSFYVTISQEKGKNKPRVRVGFCVTNKNKSILEKIREYLGVGKIRETKSGSGSIVYTLYTTTFSEALKIREFFEKYKPIVKYRELKAWCKVLDLICERKHLTEECIKIIDSIRPKNLHPRMLKQHPPRKYEFKTVCPKCGKKLKRGHHH